MGYEVHITRKEYFFDEEGEQISFEEWENYIANDNEMRLDGFAEAKTPEGILRIENEGLAVWEGWSKNEVDGGMAWMSYFEGCITCKNPDEEILKKMHKIASKLGAEVQGDEGEIYDSEGQSNWQELKEQGEKMREQISKRWWEFWK